jgi:hypothetical protein
MPGERVLPAGCDRMRNATFVNVWFGVTRLGFQKLRNTITTFLVGMPVDDPVQCIRDLSVGR